MCGVQTKAGSSPEKTRAQLTKSAGIVSCPLATLVWSATFGSSLCVVTRRTRSPPQNRPRGSSCLAEQPQSLIQDGPLDLVVP